MRLDRGQIAMAVSSILNLDLAATHRLMLLNRLTRRERSLQALIAMTCYWDLLRTLNHRGQPPQITRAALIRDPDTNAKAIVSGPSTRAGAAS